MATYKFQLTDNGQSTFSCVINGTLYGFRLTYVEGLEAHWILDIYQGDTKLLYGINLTAGCNNLVYGLLPSFPLRLYVETASKDAEHQTDAPNKTLFLYASSDEPTTRLTDKMLII